MVRWPVRKLARVGRPWSRSASSARTSSSVSSTPRVGRLGQHVAEDPLELRALPGVALRGDGQGVRGGGDRSCTHAAIGFGGRERVDRLLQPVDELRHAAGEVDGEALDVVDRQHALEQAVALLGHRHADEHAVEPRPPGAGGEVGQLEGRAVVRVEPPADAAVGDPVADAGEVFVVEAEAAAHGLAVGEVEHLARRSGGGRRRGRGAGRRRRAPGWSGAASGRRGGRAGPSVGAPRAAARTRRRRPTSPAPNVAWMSGANVSMSGHITITSRGSSVSSSASRWRIASRNTSTWRARPWQEWIWMLRSVGSNGRGRRAAGVGADVGLDAGEEPVVADLDRMVMRRRARRVAEHELHLARVLAPRGEQAVGGERRGVVVGAPDDRLVRADLVPQRGRGVEEEQMHLTAGGERAQDREVAGREAGQAEERQPLREVDERGLGSQARACGLEPLGGARLFEPLSQPAPELGLPRGLVRDVDLPARPPADHLGPVQRVAVEQLGDVAQGGEAPGAPVGVFLVAQMDPQAAQPRLVQALLDHLEQRPHRARRRPGVGIRIDARGGRDGVADEAVREREVDVRAHPVRPAGRGPEPRGEPLRQPALHPSCRDRDDVGREGVGQRIGQEAAECLNQSVGALSAVDVEHALTLTIDQDRVRPPRRCGPRNFAPAPAYTG